jgi:enoyl-CoA hydratase/carnithine racemase
VKDGTVGASVGGVPARILGSESAAPGRVEHRMSERITVEISDGIADVRLNRGDKMNAMDGPMFTALIETADELAKTEGLRAVVLSGNGPAWCAGLDFSGFQSMAGGG